MATDTTIEGGWYGDAVRSGNPHFVPTGLPVALCAAPKGRYYWPYGTQYPCGECSDIKARIEAEMAQAATSVE